MRGLKTDQKKLITRQRKLVMAIGCMLNYARSLSSEIVIQDLDRIEQTITRRLNKSLDTLVAEYQNFIIQNSALFASSEKTDQKPRDTEETIKFEKLREIDYEDEEKEEMLEDVKRIKHIMGDIKEISKDVAQGVEEQGHVLQEVEKETAAVMQESKEAGQQLKKGAKYKNSSLKWWLGGTLTVVGAAIGTLIPVPGLGTAIGAGAGAAIGGSIGAGIEQVKNKKLKEVKFQGKAEVAEQRDEENNL